MAIEIKELVVKFTVEQPMNNSNQNRDSQSISNGTVKDIINQCTEAVLSKLNRFEER